ncbi:MAG: iron ABC transporter permease [Deltaproteobacteria bacterium]|nr:iron ABC transporter permease [Deltaproteobacteria bacterium]MBW2050542.1 iron ABC transporter permease [Deltaproteobacteria bacterium]MBW2129809.1 iron ABC transporter permease [Deltaproteobacteria bacterium]MBW2304893.1 iron ABC transporter permease [Deltaproteobacteria bacterium]
MSTNAETLCLRYQTHARVRTLFLASAIILLIVATTIGLCCGASGMSFWEIVSSLHRDMGRGHSIIWMLRLPRIVMAALVGFGLGLAGVVFQAILRNPLASPFTLGVGSGAGFGAVSVILFWGGGFQTYRVACGAFLFSLVSATVIIAVAKMKRASSETMILTGIALMFLFSSLTSLFQYMGTMEQVHEIVFWFFGSLSKAGWNEIGLAAAMILVPFPILLRRAWDFNLLASGDESALALGVNVNRLRMWAVAAASLVTAGCICFTGVIGFVGLVAPHITRMVIGNDHRFLLPASALVGAVILVTADTLGRTLWAPQVIPIGIVTSFIGVPFFFYLLMKRSREYW